MIKLHKIQVPKSGVVAVEQTLLANDLVLSKGRFVKELEKQSARMAETDYAVAVANGTAAITLALQASLNPGSEVITSPFTWKSAIYAIVNAGMIPRFADIRFDWTINPTSIKKLINPNTGAIIATHIFGKMCEMEYISDIANESGLVLIEDASQAHFASDGKFWAGGRGDFGTFSFYATKGITCGEGGAIVTNDEAYYNNLLLLRDSGIVNFPKGSSNIVIGGNQRLSELNAALSYGAFEHEHKEVSLRNDVASKYIDEMKLNHPQQPGPYETHAWHRFVLTSVRPVMVQQHLAKYNIESSRLYQNPVNLDKMFIKKVGMIDQTPSAYGLSLENIAIPIGSHLSDDDIDKVIEVIGDPAIKRTITC